jgi:type VI protein secretion system component VasF
MSGPLLKLYVWQLTFRSAHAAPRRDERGEGVISAAIAVLIMAFLGAMMWVGFQQTLDRSQDKVDQQIEKIGGP